MTQEKTGIIVKSTGGLYTVEKQDGTHEECRAKGAFRHSGITPLAGDRVVFEKQEGKEGFITKIMERKNSLIRPAVANVDLLCVVTAIKDPDPDLFILDKLMAVAKKNDIDVLVIINKIDTADPAPLKRVYNEAGFETVEISAVNKDEYDTAIEKIRHAVNGKICFFTGASGVGKSSVLNAVFSQLSLETGEISKNIRRGKHTTRVTTLFKMGENTYVGDTPGFSMLDVAGFNMLDTQSLLSSFPDIEKYALNCKYKKCTHVCEDGCGVIEALNRGEIVKSRHESYVSLFNELKSIKPWDNK